MSTILRISWLTAIVAVLASLSGAVVSTQENTWTLASDRVQATFRLTAAGLVLEGMSDPRTGTRFDHVAAPDTTATINGSQTTLGAAGWVLQGVAAEETDAGSTLKFSFRSQRAPVTAERSYACYLGSPAIEAWTTFRATGATAATITNLNIWQMTIAASTLHYEFGLRGDAAGAAVDEAFSLQSATLSGGQQVNLQEQNRSSEHYLPMIGADADANEFFGGVMWSGSWQMLAQGLTGNQARIAAGIPGVTFTVDAGHPLETPHGFFGFTPGGRAEIAPALRAFVLQGVRQGRPFRPMVTDNTWFSYSTEIDQESMMDEMAGAASVGVELFVVDAGWYLGSGSGDDFTSGLGTWQVDPERFPDGLGALRDYAHSLGMQFGLWVEPERVALSTVGRPQLAQQSWLASNNGNFGATTSAQICLASPAARQWVLDRLFALLDDVQPDYLKWDNNLWVNCNRTGHSHGSTDGNFAHTRALYDVLAALRERYPDMLIENCSQGGNRADFGMLRYTDTAWMDDRTSPAAHVRHNLEGLMTFFPPAYLLSFVLNDNEPIVDSPDLGLFLRSRMPGILGLTYRSSELTESDRDRLAAEIGVYRRVREIAAEASGALLTEQAAPEDGPAWDAVQEVRADSADAVVFAYQNDGAVPGVVLHPRGLEPATRYEISSIEGELLGTATGEDLMADGLAVHESFESAARVILLRPVSRGASVNRSKRDE